MLKCSDINSCMIKITQWYVSNLQHGDCNYELSNYFPYKKLEHQSIEKIIDELQFANGKGNFGRYTLINDPEYHSWRNFSHETEIKYIDQHTYQEDSINIFPIRFIANEDEIFTQDNLCPFDNLPNQVMRWLQKHTSCSIVFHDPHEAKNLAESKYRTIPSLVKKRNKFNLKNRFIYIDSSANADRLYKSTAWKIPEWLYFVGASHWLQFVSHTISRHEIENIKKICSRKPNFDTGRFMMYSGRYKPTRYLIIANLLETLPKKQFWASVSTPQDIDKKIQQEVNFDLLKDNQVPLDAGDIKTLDNLFERVPINTFPAELQENAVSYEKLDYFWIPNPKHYSRAFIDISCESYNDRFNDLADTIFLTEKICKPIMAGRPFICSGNDRLYTQLKELGFKTFDRWWDESFAYQCGTKEHIKRFTQTVKSVSEWSDTQTEQCYNEMRPILQHNQQLLHDLSYNSERLWMRELRKLRHKKLI